VSMALNDNDFLVNLGKPKGSVSVTKLLSENREM
jgi:hypothetical protein